MLLSAGQSRVIYSGALARASVACEYIYIYSGDVLLRFLSRILKFKSQLTIAFFAADNHLIGPLRKQNFTLKGSKGQGL